MDELSVKGLSPKEYASIEWGGQSLHFLMLTVLPLLDGGYTMRAMNTQPNDSQSDALFEDAIRRLDGAAAHVGLADPVCSGLADILTLGKFRKDFLLNDIIITGNGLPPE